MASDGTGLYEPCTATNRPSLSRTRRSTLDSSGILSSFEVIPGQQIPGHFDQINK
jgi:hypothetical protein